MSPPRDRARSQDDRDTAHRTRTNPHGIPAYREPELTPPPQEPPRPRDLPGYETIAPPIRAQLDILAEGQAQVVEAIGKVWELRDGRWRERIEEALASLAKSATTHDAILSELKPQLDRWRAATDALTTHVPRLTATIEALSGHLGGVEQRLRAVEITVAKMTDRISSDSEDIEQRLDHATQERARMDKRLRDVELELNNRKVTERALAKQERNRSAKTSGAVAGLVALIAAVVQHFTH